MDRDLFSQSPISGELDLMQSVGMDIRNPTSWMHTNFKATNKGRRSSLLQLQTTDSFSKQNKLVVPSSAESSPGPIEETSNKEGSMLDTAFIRPNADSSLTCDILTPPMSVNLDQRHSVSYDERFSDSTVFKGKENLHESLQMSEASPVITEQRVSNNNSTPDMSWNTINHISPDESNNSEIYWTARKSVVKEEIQDVNHQSFADVSKVRDEVDKLCIEGSDRYLGKTLEETSIPKESKSKTLCEEKEIIQIDYGDDITMGLGNRGNIPIVQEDKLEDYVEPSVKRRRRQCGQKMKQGVKTWEDTIFSTLEADDNTAVNQEQSGKQTVYSQIISKHSSKELAAEKLLTSGAEVDHGISPPQIDKVSLERLMEDLQLPFDDPTPSKSDNKRQKSKVSTEVTKCCKRKRRSADLDIMAMHQFISPTPSPSAIHASDLPLGLSQPRRSSRLRRKSLVIYRSQSAEDDLTIELKDNISQSPDAMSIPDGINNNKESLCLTEDQGKDITEVCGDIVCEQLSTSMQLSENSDGEGYSSSHEVDIINNDHAQTIEKSESPSLSTSKNDTSRRSTRKRTLVDATYTRGSNRKRTLADATYSNNLPLSHKVTRTRKKKDEPSVEDIYLNKLWKQQMPKQKLWETIFESPKVGKNGVHKLVGMKRMKRQIVTEDFYSQTKLKHRRQKASKLGWTPKSKKKEKEKFEALMQKWSKDCEEDN